MQTPIKPLVLVILDGWGHREATEYNAIAAALTPFWDTLNQVYPTTLIQGSGRCVGLPDGQMGNSEVGHLSMGAGRTVYQDFTRIEEAIADRTFFSNPVLINAIDNSVASGHALHIMGLLSPGGVHSHERQIIAALQLAAQRGATRVFLHCILDGRDTPPRSASDSLLALQEQCHTLKCGKISSIIGRYYAMDRDKRWDRVEKAYDLLTQGKADFHTHDALSGLTAAYARGEDDEFVSATSIHLEGERPHTLQTGDTLLFMNFRADRAREILHTLIDPAFAGFERTHLPTQLNIITLTQYDKNFPVSVAYPPIPLTHILGEILSQHHLKQLRIAETEKYAHVTFFFNGGVEKPFEGEERILIPSAKVATYNLKPEMSAFELTDALIDAIQTNRFDVIICNFANPDMVGHTGDFAATVKAIEVIDDCLEKILTALNKVGGEAIITADHGNAEMMFDPTTGQAHTAHTEEKVPFIYIGRPAHIVKQNGTLCDIAPTLLYLLGIKQPTEMTGQSLVTLDT